MERRRPIPLEHLYHFRLKTSIHHPEQSELSVIDLRVGELTYTPVLLRRKSQLLWEADIPLEDGALVRIAGTVEPERGMKLAAFGVLHEVFSLGWGGIIGNWPKPSEIERSLRRYLAGDFQWLIAELERQINEDGMALDGWEAEHGKRLEGYRAEVKRDLARNARLVAWLRAPESDASRSGEAPE